MKITFDSDDDAQKFLHDVCLPLQQATGSLLTVGAARGVGFIPRIEELSGSMMAAYFAHFADRVQPKQLAAKKELVPARCVIVAGDVGAVLVEKKRGSVLKAFAGLQRCTCGGKEPPCRVCVPAGEAVGT